MSDEGPREPRFSSMGPERPAPDRLGAPEPMRVASEPAEEPVPASLDWGNRTIWRLLGGIGAAVVLAIVIIVATRRPASHSAPPANAVASSAVPTVPATVPGPATSAPPPAADDSTGQVPAAPSTVSPSPPQQAPSATPPANAPPAAAPPVAPPSSGHVPAIRAPAVTAPSGRHVAAATPSPAAISQHGPKHRRRGPSEAAPWLVQVGAFKSAAPAKAEVERLARDGWSARTANGSGGWTIVEITGYRTREEALHAARSLAAKAHVQTLVRRLKFGGKTAAGHKSDSAD